MSFERLFSSKLLLSPHQCVEVAEIMRERMQGRKLPIRTILKQLRIIKIEDSNEHIIVHVQLQLWSEEEEQRSWQPKGTIILEKTPAEKRRDTVVSNIQMCTSVVIASATFLIIHNHEYIEQWVQFIREELLKNF